MKKKTQEWMGDLAASNLAEPADRDAARDALDSDARLRAEVRELREKARRFDAIAAQHDCDHPRQSHQDVGCIGGLLDLSVPLPKRKARR